MSWQETAWSGQWVVVAVLLVLLVLQIVHWRRAVASRPARLSADVQRGTQPPNPEDQ